MFARKLNQTLKSLFSTPILLIAAIVLINILNVGIGTTALANENLCETSLFQVHDASHHQAEPSHENGRHRADRAVVDQIATTPETRAMLNALLAFADKHNLNERIIEVGPRERRLKRLAVALDVRNEGLVREYMETFNLHRDLDNQRARTLSLEFDKEVVGNYVFGALRTGWGPGVQVGLWRWGRTSVDQTADWFVHGQGDPRTHLIGYAHLIPVSTDEALNVERFLEHPEERGPCKSDNCIAWTTGIELGRTDRNATPEERRLLFNELGISRSIAHYEIARRIAHAANARHVAMVVYYRDEVGLENFRHLEDIMPPEPQQPFPDIIKGLVRNNDTPIARAMSVIPDGAKVYFPIAAGASPEGMSALIDHAVHLQHGVDVHVLVNGVSEAVFKRGIQTSDGKFRVKAHFLGGNLRQLYKDGKIELMPGYLSDFARYIANPNMPDYHYDAMVVRVSPPDEHGRYSLGPNNDMVKTIMRLRPGIKIIAEVNPNVPFALGDNFIQENEISAKFESTSELAGPAKLPAHEPEFAIGRNLAHLIPDGSTVQIGIGGTFGGFPQGMREAGRRGIKFFTEMMGDQMMEMINDGVADGATTGFVYGSKELYKWIDHNPKVQIMETPFTNDPSRIAATPGFHAVNTALQVSLYGNVNATHGPDGRMSSPGGQVEFMSGAVRAPGGKAIIAIKATAKGGTISTIVLDTYAGATTTPHEMVTHVVTEFGIAELAGKSEGQRALALIRIADPHFRSQLAQQALERRLISPEMRAEFP